MRVALTGTKKKTKKCLANPKLLRRIPAKNTLPPTTPNDSSSGNEGTSYGARSRRQSNAAGPSFNEGSDRGESPFKPPMTSTMATPDEGTDEDSTQSKKPKKAAKKSYCNQGCEPGYFLNML